MIPKLKVTKLKETAILPKYAHFDDSGLDLFSTERVVIKPSQVELVLTGIAIELPQNTEAQIRPRSGLALKNSITVLNTPGTIDSGYRGEVGVILINHGKQEFWVEPGMRIAQLVIAPVIRVDVQEIEVDYMTKTSRNVGAWGSTGVH